MQQNDLSMADENMVLEQLRKIRVELDVAHGRDHEMMVRLSDIKDRIYTYRQE